jgi:biotin-(acetyl-CoA carboxylase) ligase
MTQIVVLPHSEYCPEGSVLEVTPGTTICEALLENDIPIEHVLQTVCKCLEVEYLKLKAGKLSQIDSEYQLNLWKLNQWQLFEVKGKQEMMKILGVTTGGLLKTENKKGSIEEWRNGEVGFVKEN